MTNKWEDYLIGGDLFGGRYLRWMRKVQRHKNLYSLKEWNNCFHKCGFKIVKSIGYEGEKAVHFNEILHFTSFGLLIVYKLFRKWVLFPEIYNI